MSDDENPFSRWSRRRRLVAEEAAREVSEPELPAVSGDPIPEPETEEEETRLLEELGLPVPETLKGGDDFSVFMRAGVPDFLRRRALKILWRSNPVLANLDGLNDYDDDFRSPELTQKVLATAYKVGRGILRDPVEPAPAAPADETPAEETETEPGVEVAETGSPDNSDLPQDADEVIAEAAPEAETEEPAIRPKRMRFDTNT